MGLDSLALGDERVGGLGDLSGRGVVAHSARGHALSRAASDSGEHCMCVNVRFVLCSEYRGWELGWELGTGERREQEDYHADATCP
jgi:hypothetical protein